MDDKNKTKLFGKFHQVGSHVTRKHGGTGLGLAITKQLVGLMKGSVSVATNQEAISGTCFEVFIQLGRLPTSTTTRHSGKDWKMQSLVPFSVAAVEPSPLVQKHISSQFASAGIAANLTFCQSIKELTDLLQSKSVDCIMVDLEGYNVRPAIHPTQTREAKHDGDSQTSDGNVDQKKLQLADGLTKTSNIGIVPKLTNMELEQLSNVATSVRPEFFCILCSSIMMVHTRHLLQALNPIIFVKPIKTVVLKRLYRIHKKLAMQQLIRLKNANANSGKPVSPATGSPKAPGRINLAGQNSVATKDSYSSEESSLVNSPTLPTYPVSLAPSAKSAATIARPLANAPVVRYPPASLKILLVEDNPVIQNVLVKILARLSLKCDIAEDGVEALEMITDKDRYDFIFMDHMMPRMDGITAAKILRERYPAVNEATQKSVSQQTLNGSNSEENKGVEESENLSVSSSSSTGNSFTSVNNVYRPWVCALTANVMATDQIEYAKAGMNDCLIKPATIQDIANAIMKYLDSDSNKILDKIGSGAKNAG